MEINAKVQEAYDFINKAAVKNDNGSYTVKLKDYNSYMDTQGLPEQTMQAVRDANANWNSALYLKAADVLKDNIEAAKKAGEDVTKVSAKVITNVYNGREEITLKAQKTFPNPSNPGAAVVKHAVLSLDIDQTRSIDKSLMEGVQEDIKRILGA